MIDLSALTSSTGLTAAPDKPAAQAGEGAQGADFLALLTAQSFAPGVAAAADSAVTAADPATLPVAVDPASAAAVLPQTGKILPSVLPQLPVSPDAPTIVDTKPQPDTPQPAAPPSASLTLPLARVLLARFRQADPEVPEPQAEADAPEAPTAALDPEANPAAIATLALPVLAAEPAPASSTPDPVLTGAPALPQALPVLASQQQAAAPTLPPRQPQTDTRQESNPPVLTVPAAAAPLAQTPLVAPQPGEVRPVATLRVAVADDASRPVDPVVALDPAVPAIAPQSLAAPAPDAPTITAQAAPVTRPHEFGALVDRLVQAREALQPQAVTMAVQHAEFGPVQLHFRHQDNALSVSMASADPDFARAVSAAVPPVLAAPSADTASFASGQRQDQPGQTASDSSSQPRGQSAQTRDERGQPRTNPARTNPAQPGDTASARQGIFA